MIIIFLSEALCYVVTVHTGFVSKVYGQAVCSVNEFTWFLTGVTASI